MYYRIKYKYIFVYIYTIVDSKEKIFPNDFTNKELRDELKEAIKWSSAGDSDISEPIVYSIKMQLALSEIHKRENNKTNMYILAVAIIAVLLSILSILLQWQSSLQQGQPNIEEMQKPIRSWGPHGCTYSRCQNHRY